MSKLRKSGHPRGHIRIILHSTSHVEHFSELACSRSVHVAKTQSLVVKKSAGAEPDCAARSAPRAPRQRRLATKSTFLTVMYISTITSFKGGQAQPSKMKKKRALSEATRRFGPRSWEKSTKAAWNKYEKRTVTSKIVYFKESKLIQTCGRGRDT